VDVSILPVLCARHLLPDMVLCKYDLHGRCSVKLCSDVHLDDLLSQSSWERALQDLVFVFSHRCKLARSVTQGMLERALDSQVLLTRNAIERGTDVENCLRRFVVAVAPLCVAFTDSNDR
jgi:hypothetical protein